MLPKKYAPNGLYLYCGTHDRWYKNDNVVKCKCNLKFKARIHIPGTKRGTRIKTLNAIDVDQALQEFFAYKEFLNTTNYQPIQIKKEMKKPIFLTDCMQAFIDFKKGINVETYQKKHIDKKTLRGFERSLEYFLFALQEKGLDARHLLFTDINPKIVGIVTDYLSEDRGLSAKSVNNAVAEIKSFMKFIISTYYPTFTNEFDKVEKLKVRIDTTSITMKEFLDVIKVTTPENSMMDIWHGKKFKNIWKDYWIDAFFLGLYTGGRLEEITHMKWNDFVFNDENKISFIELSDFKIMRARKDWKNNSEEKKKRVEMTPHFEMLLTDMGMSQKIGSDEYILAPERSNRKQLGTDISKAFSHYIALLKLPEEKTFKHLRKTYLTNTFIESANEQEFLAKGGHTNMDTPKKHYIDWKVVLEARRKKMYGESDHEGNTNVD